MAKRWQPWVALAAALVLERVAAPILGIAATLRRFEPAPGVSAWELVGALEPLGWGMAALLCARARPRTAFAFGAGATVAGGAALALGAPLFATALGNYAHGVCALATWVWIADRLRTERPLRCAAAFLGASVAIAIGHLAGAVGAEAVMTAAESPLVGGGVAALALAAAGCALLDRGPARELAPAGRAHVVGRGAVAALALLASAAVTVLAGLSLLHAPGIAAEGAMVWAVTSTLTTLLGAPVLLALERARPGSSALRLGAALVLASILGVVPLAVAAPSAVQLVLGAAEGVGRTAAGLVLYAWVVHDATPRRAALGLLVVMLARRGLVALGRDGAPLADHGAVVVAFAATVALTLALAARGIERPLEPAPPEAPRVF